MAPDKFPLANAPQFFPRMNVGPKIASRKFKRFGSDGCHFSRPSGAAARRSGRMTKHLPSSRSRGTTARQANDEGRRKPECLHDDEQAAHFFRHSGFTRRAVATQRRVIPSSLHIRHSSLLDDFDSVRELWYRRHLACQKTANRLEGLFSMTAGTAVFRTRRRECGD